MTDYRLYFFDERQHIRERLDLSRQTDEEAVAAAQSAAGGAHVELWRGAVLVKSFPASRAR